MFDLKRRRESLWYKRRRIKGKD